MADRLAVLLGAGLPLRAACRALAEDAALDARVRAAVARGADAIADLGTASRDPAARMAWAALGAALRVADRSGAPLAPTLERIAVVCVRAAETERRRGVALAGPLASRRLMLGLPPAGLVLALLLGADVSAFLASSVGAAAVSAGLLLTLCGAVWSRRLVIRAAAVDALPGVALDLVAVALTAGAPPPRAARIAAEACRHVGLDFDGGGVRTATALAVRAGAPAAPLLRAEADRARRDAAADAERAAERLAVRLVLPLGACVLPAFVLIGVVPIALSVLGASFAP